MKINEHECVVLTRALPGEKLEAGDVGTALAQLVPARDDAPQPKRKEIEDGRAAEQTRLRGQADRKAVGEKRVLTASHLEGWVGAREISHAHAQPYAYPYTSAVLDRPVL